MSGEGSRPSPSDSFGFTTAFVAAAHARARILKCPDLATLVIEHPLASRTADDVRVIAEKGIEQLVGGLVAKDE